MFICFNKLEYTTHFLFIEDEYLPFFTVGHHSSAYDPFLHVALSNRVDPRVLMCHSLLRLAPMRIALVSVQKHTFLYRTAIFSTLFVLIFSVVAYQSLFSVLKSGVKSQYC